jgi:hypothetical protein
VFDPDPVLVWDWEHGFVINADTGEVVDQIYVASYIDGFDKRSTSDLVDRVHYAKFREMSIKLSSGERGVYRDVASYLRMNGIELDHGEQLLLARVVKSMCSSTNGSSYRSVAVAIAYTFLKMKRVFRSLESICRDMDVKYSDCTKASRFVLRLSTVVGKISRVKHIASIVESYPDRAVSRVAQILMNSVDPDDIPYASPRVLAGVFLYLANIIVSGNYVPLYGENGLAKKIGVAPQSVSRVAKKLTQVMGIDIARDQMGTVVRMKISSKLCREIEKLGIPVNSVVVCV